MTPGEILREEFLRPLDLSQGELADHIGPDVKVINRLVAEALELVAKTSASFTGQYLKKPLADKSTRASVARAV
ncbi:MAG TPA: hypothetical protein VLJ37_08620 [bacterium]|nr:hypothetical protein [bacterium]